MIHTLDNDKWTWVNEQDGKVTATLTASPLHNGLVFLERLKLEEGTPGIVGTKLFKQCMDECFLRGYKAFITVMDPTRSFERHLMYIARKRYGCYVSTNPFMFIVGSTIGKLTEEEKNSVESMISKESR